MVEEELHSEDVTDIAEDEDKLRGRYREVTGNEGLVEEVLAKPVTIQGPFEHTTAVIVWLRSDVGTVKVFLGDRNVQTWQTSPVSRHRVLMTFLDPGYYCWWMNGARVKYIK
jgi:hypothetical protein